MSEVKRYVPTYNLRGDGDADMKESETGDYVDYADYAALKAECESNAKSAQYSAETNRKVVSKNADLYEQLLKMKAERDALDIMAEERRQFILNGVEMGYIILPVIDGDPAIGIHDRCLLKPEFASYAYANQLRAEGVEMFAAHQIAMIGNPHKNDAANSYAARSAVEYAANLRKENGNG